MFVTIDGKFYKLLKAMYGLRDAGAAFDRKVLDVMNLMGVSLGKFSICVGYRKSDGQAGALGWRLLLEWTKVALQCIPRRAGKALVGQDDSCDGTRC